jgi:hypothetical protein
VETAALGCLVEQSSADCAPIFAVGRAAVTQASILQNLVKPPNHPDSRQPPDSTHKINLKTMSLFLSRPAIL